MWMLAASFLALSVQTPAGTVALTPYPPKPQVVITFDVEDYITPESEGIDGIPKWLAEILSEEGLSGTFFVIGEKARSLEQRGRVDVIGAMAAHEIGSHTNYGSIHPTVMEELEEAGWQDGVRRMWEQESAGIADLERIFEVPVTILGRHGGCYGPQLVAAVGRMNVSYEGSPISLPGRDVVWFANALNFSAEYTFDEDSYHRDDLFAPALEKLKAELPGLLRSSQVVSLFAGHPTKIRAEEFWDFNYYYGANPTPEEWIAPLLRPAETMITAQENFRRLVKYLKSRSDIEVTTYRAVAPLYSHQKENMTREDLLDVVAANERNGGLIYTEDFSPAEAFAGLATAISGYGRKGAVPEKIVTQHPLGPRVMPRVQPEAARATWAEVLGLARQAELFIWVNRCLPASLKTASGEIGTGSLFALFCEVYGDLASGSPRAEYAIRSFDAYPRTNDKKIAQRIQEFRGWPVHRLYLDDSRIVEFTRLQLWTLKPAHRLESGGATRTVNGETLAVSLAPAEPR